MNWHNLFKYKDGELYWRISPVTHVKVGDHVGWLDTNGYARTKYRGVTYAIHKIIWEMHYGVTDKQLWHKDGDRSNNRVENLEIKHAHSH
jgi:hypothetical protein